MTDDEYDPDAGPLTEAGRALLNEQVAIAPGQRAALRRAILAIEAEARQQDGALQLLLDIYDSSRMFGYFADGSGGPGVCCWCGAPPPDANHDHDVACPAAKAADFLAALSPTA